MSFSGSFLWGAATAAFQIEGAVKDDGRGPSVWDMFCEKDGTIFEGHSPEVACDHYFRFREDVKLMKEIGLNAYRFSISWPRVLPEGTGRINQAGLDFYSALVDELLAAGIEPVVTLFHWDMPTALYHKGGWLNRQVVDWFGEYTERMALSLGDRVKWWITLNEPQCFIGMGHSHGIQAPGDRLAPRQVLLAAHHALLAHGRAIDVLRSHVPNAQLGIAPTFTARIPLTPEDEPAAKADFFATAKKDAWSLALFTDPIYLGRYPADVIGLYGGEMPDGYEEDLPKIQRPLDFFGMNCYTGGKISTGADGRGIYQPAKPGAPVGTLSWLGLQEDSLYWVVRFVMDRYGKIPFMVTENGFSAHDWVSLDGKVHDPQRIDYTARNLRALKRAAAEGYPIAGYMHWSLMDNFEWSCGYAPRLGLVFVDYATQERTLKDSAHWYSKIIAENGASL